MRLLTRCPTCKQELVAKVLSCPDCGLEISNIFELSPFDYLDTANTDFLMCFLKSRGNLKAVQEALGISYPTAKKQLDRVITALGMANENVEVLNMGSFHATSGTDTSTLIRNKLIEAGGKAIVYSYKNIPYEIHLSESGTGFNCDALSPIYFYEFRVFDIIVDLLKSEGGEASKGQPRKYKVGSEKCNEHTVAGAIALNYFNKVKGETVLDPQSVLDAILVWADIAENGRGSIRLTENYRKLVNYHV